jgi:spermidine/putrescine-binding protein
MRETKVFRFMAALIVLSLFLAACGGGGTASTQAPAATEPPATQAPATEPAATEASTATDAATQAATEAPTTGAMPAFTSVPSDKTASSGFVCPEPNPKMEVTSKELNLFVWTDYIPQDILDCFEAVYGVKVNRDEYSSNEEMYAKLTGGATSYDLVQPTNNFVAPMIRNNLLQKLDHSKLPILSNFAPQYLNLPFDPNNEYTIPYEAGTDAIVYNSDVITEAPTSWKDLWKPGCASKNMIMLDGAHDIIGATLLSLGYDVNTKDQAQLDEAKAKLKELAPCIKIYDSDSPKTALIAGDADLGITWTGDAFLAGQENPAIKYVYPKEGAILWQDNWAMLKDAAHTDAAYAWLNYSMQPDLFWTMLRDWPYNNPNQAALDFAKDNQMETTDANGGPTTLAKIYDAYINSPVTNTPPEDVKSGHWLDDLGDASPVYDQIWTEVKGQ